MDYPIAQKPTNFIVFVGHSVAKILLIVYFTIRWESVRFELYALLFSLIILYILNLIKSAISKLPSQLNSSERRYQFVS